MSKQSNESIRGETMPILAYELSLVVAFATGAAPHYCYANVWHAIMELLLLQDARLVEGWIVLEQQTQVSVTEHCWCECPDGLIIDPSLVLLVRRGYPIFYFSGIRHARSEVENLSCRDLPYVRSVGIYGPDGMGHADYRAAYHAAYEQARTRVAASAPPKSLIVQPSALPPAESGPGKLAMRIVSSRTFLRSRNEQIGL
jgi:hypothetical protein